MFKLSLYYIKWTGGPVVQGPSMMTHERRLLRNHTMISRILISSVVSIFLLTGLAECHVKLNVPRVRMPYFDNLSVNFTLQVDTPGCYRW